MMKKKLAYSLVLLFCAASFLAPEHSGAVPSRQRDHSRSTEEATGSWSIDIGVAVQYLWWQPAFRSELRGDQSKEEISNTLQISDKHFSMAPSLSAGPVVSIAMPRGFGLTSRFLWSSHTAHSMFNSIMATPIIYNYGITTDITRWELSTAVDYAFAGIFKLSAGILYSGYTCDKFTNQVRMPFAYYIEDRKDRSWGLGPELGIRAVLPLAGPLYLGADVSAFYLYTRYYQGGSIFFSPTFGTSSLKSRIDYSYHGLGMELAAQLMLRQDPPHLTFSLGFRYRFVKYIRGQYGNYVSYINNAGNTGIGPSKDKLHVVDHLFGFTFSVTHAFNF
jgi:hypothetical protein